MGDFGAELTSDEYHKSQNILDDNDSVLLRAERPTQHSDDDFFKAPDDIPEVIKFDNLAEEQFGIERGLFAKFTNARPNDTKAILQNQINAQEAKREETESLNSSFLSIKEFDSEKETFERQESIVEKIILKPKTDFWFVFSVLITTFGVEFINSVEIVYITPYFLMLNLDDRIDATFWMFPVIITLISSPIIEVISSHIKYKKLTQQLMMLITITGCVMFAFSEEIALTFVETKKAKLTFLTYFGLVAFCAVDCSNEMISFLERKVIDESGRLKESLQKQATIASSAGKIFGFLCGSLQALGLEPDDIGGQVLQKNLDLCFIIAAIIMTVALLFNICFQPKSTKGYKTSIMSKLKKLKFSHFLPPTSRVFNSSRKVKMIILTHLFGAANILMLTVYATSWVGITVLQGDPEESSTSLRHQLFEAGVSWGSLALLLTSFIILATGYAVHKLLEDPKKAKFKYAHILSQLLASLALLSCFFSNDFMDIFIILPLTGFAFETFHSIPEILADLAEIEERDSFKGRYRSLLGFSFFSAQVLMFLIMPCIFLMFPDSDDNLWGMFIAGTSGLLSVIFALFV